ncbi:Fic/DOC family protein [Bacillus sp. 1P06AnD]|uniref:Fic/DOC family protein n=1 Tax=Bacillus sp. 1P06AnD TaxID=3132208 RepID=UPI0039A06A27
MTDKYKTFYPDTHVLINHFNVKDQDELDKLETGFTLKRLADLGKTPIEGNFDFKHLKDIHQYIFQDIYPFAGQTRNEDISKGTFTFASHRFIEQAGQELFEKLKREKNLSHLDTQQFSMRAAYYMGEINVLHPFREGNGRTQREFIRELALDNGYIIDWSLIKKEHLLEASIRSITNELPLAKVIETCISNKDLIKEQEPEIER